MIVEQNAASGQLRYLPGAGFTAVGAATWQYTATARTSVSTAAALSDAPTGGFFKLLRVDQSGGGRWSGVDIMFMAKTASQSVNYRVYLIHAGEGGNSVTSPLVTDYEYQLYGSGTFTTVADTCVGVANGAIIRPDEFMAETITFTADALVANYINSMYGSPGYQICTFPTGTKRAAHLGIPDVGSGIGVYIGFAATAGVVCNAVVQGIGS